MTTLSTTQALAEARGAPLSVRLAAVRRRTRWTALGAGAAEALLAVLLTAAAAYAVDRWVDLPFFGRFLALAGCLIAACVGLAHGVLRPLVRRLPDEDLALRVEGHFGGLRSLLISALQLRQAGAEPGISAALIDAVERQAVEEARRLDLRRVVETARLKRLALAAILLTGAALLYAARQGDMVHAWAMRLLHPFRELAYPTLTHLTPLTGRLAVPAGDSALVAVVADGRVPNVGTLYYERTGGDRGALACQVDTADGRTFRLTLRPVTANLWYWFVVGDGRTRRNLIEALPRPELTDLVVSTHLPAYVGQADPPPSRLREVEALVGSQVRLDGEARVPAANGLSPRDAVNRATLVLAAGPRYDLAVTADGRFSGDFPLRQDDAYQIRLSYDHSVGLASDGRPETVTVESAAPIWYRLRALPDKPPAIEVVEPAPTVDATPVGEVALRVNVTDDYGVAGAGLWYTVRRAPPPAPGGAPAASPSAAETDDRTVPVDRRTFTRVDLPGRFGSRRVRLEHDWLIATTSAQAGDRIIYYLSAADTREDPGPNLVESDLYEIAVVSLDEMERQLREKRESIQGEIRRLYERERELRGRVDDLRERGVATQPAATRPTGD
jgi:hypothetical protein